jgi:hypothetical protein
MVSSKNRDISSKFRNYNKNEALADWIKNVKTKKIIKKRQSRGTDLRSLAILNIALCRAESELRRKREERVQKWAQIKLRLNENNYKNSEDSIDNYNSAKIDEDEENRKKEAKALWHSDLNGLDNFINNLNSIKTVVVR